ncbi:Threonine dehydratase [Hordeum vulgare]|nr:Threonine dehydratase [Hordeum vulgare]
MATTPVVSGGGVITPRGPNLLEQVSDLFDPRTGTWDIQLVRDNFWPDDVKHILQIPLRDGTHDFMAWQYEKKGVHSVKSTYKLQVHLERMKQDGGVGGSSHEAGNLDIISDDSWKRMWKLPFPRNIQMFAWRLKHDSVVFPTHVARKGIPIAETKCLFYGGADEDRAHLFIKCKNLKAVWREIAMERERTTLVKIGHVHAVLDFVWGLDVKKWLHILTFWWMWWSNRNKLCQGELPWSADVVVRRTRSSVLEYLDIFGKQSDKTRPDMWRPPAQTEYKININGSFVPGLADRTTSLTFLLLRSSLCRMLFILQQILGLSG